MLSIAPPTGVLISAWISAWLSERLLIRTSSISPLKNFTAEDRRPADPKDTVRRGNPARRVRLAHERCRSRESRREGAIKARRHVTPSIGNQRLVGRVPTIRWWHSR